tara:strand:+ start:102 stop:572 length:471 start_codon:yes stop_codon:yes gene_type:complete
MSPLTFEEFKNKLEFKDNCLYFIKPFNVYAYHSFLNFHYSNRDLIGLISFKRELEANQLDKFSDDDWFNWCKFKDLKDNDLAKYGYFNSELNEKEIEIVFEFYEVLYKTVHDLSYSEISLQNSDHRIREKFFLIAKAESDNYKKLYNFLQENENFD